MASQESDNHELNTQTVALNPRWGFYVNVQSCVGCKACQVACKDKNNLGVGILWRKVVEVSGGEWIQNGPFWIDGSFSYFLSTACNHCERPICKEVCPTQAIRQRNDGIVLIDNTICVGCRYCEWACPYSAPRFDETAKVMTKCNLCYDLLDQGKRPACVSACQMRVLEYGDIGALRARYGDLDDIFPLPERKLTNPAVTFTPHIQVARTQSNRACIGNEEEI